MDKRTGRFVVGLDLGTTNCALAYVDRAQPLPVIEVLDIEQEAEGGGVAPRRLLPSSVLVRPQQDKERTLNPFLIGEEATRRGARLPGRLVTSAKSWLAHDRVDRQAQILPWHGSADVARISPVIAQSLLLQHMVEAWNTQVAGDRVELELAHQEVVVTVPASFDASARRLTLEAARLAGLDAPVLVEEPQAAMYAWLAAHPQAVGNALPVGSSVLVVDIGGGTTDLTLLQVEQEDDQAVLRRLAVSDHLLLGGDNIDVALARLLVPRFESAGGQLEARDWPQLQFLARQAKEALLAPDAPQEVRVTWMGSGSKLVASARTATMSRQEVHNLVLDGFLPLVDLDDCEPRGAHGGLQELGLPFASDPAMTRHIAWFLSCHAQAGQPAFSPTAVLFNGGSVSQPLVRQRILDAIAQATGSRPQELAAVDFDCSVARGAAYFGLAREGRGVRIRGGLPRAYYVGVESSEGSSALCVVPRGLEAGDKLSLPTPMAVRANRPVVFPLYVSTVRDDQPGDVVAIDEHTRELLHPLPPLVTALRTKKRRAARSREIPVRLTACLNELGVLELACEATDNSGGTWLLEQMIRRPAALVGGEEARDGSSGPVAADLAEAMAVLAAAVDDQPPHGDRLRSVARRLESLLGGPREGWSLAICRQLFDALTELADRRAVSAEHEARLFNLAGLCLRPGYGDVLDAYRVAELWRWCLAPLAHPRANEVCVEVWIAHRRIAGGLTAGQQVQLLSKLRRSLEGKGPRVPAHELAELWRLAASLERLPHATKHHLGNLLLQQLESGRVPWSWGVWALGRLGARRPVYGPLNEVLPSHQVEVWIRALKRLAHGREVKPVRTAMVQLARLTGDPVRDVRELVCGEVVDWLRRNGASESAVRPLEHVEFVGADEQQLVLGDSLPTGLFLLGSA